MKKIIVLILALLVTLALVACGDPEQKDDSDATGGASSVESTDETTADETTDDATTTDAATTDATTTTAAA